MSNNICHLIEYANNRGNALRVDRTRGVIQGVKILGLKSANGREYLPEAVRRAAALYEGAKVNVDHPRDPKAQRSYGDRIGHLQNVICTAGGLQGDLHFNPKHALAEQLCWDAENAPHNVGLSHNAEGQIATKHGRVVVEAITKVHSVDLVADPATNSSLYESHTPLKTIRQLAESLTDVGIQNRFTRLIEDELPMLAGTAASPAVPDVAAGDNDNDKLDAAFKAMILTTLDDDSLDSRGKLPRIKTLLEAKDKLLGKLFGEEPAPDDSDAGDADCGDGTAQEGRSGSSLAALREELAQLKARDQVRSLVESLGVEANAVQIEAAIALPEPKRKSFLGTLPKRGRTFGGAARSSKPFQESRVDERRSFSDRVKSLR